MSPVTSQRLILDELFYKVEQTSTVFNAKRYNRSFLRMFHSSRLSMLKTRSCHRKTEVFENDDVTAW